MMVKSLISLFTRHQDRQPELQVVTFADLLWQVGDVQRSEEATVLEDWGDWLVVRFFDGEIRTIHTSELVNVTFTTEFVPVVNA